MIAIQFNVNGSNAMSNTYTESEKIAFDKIQKGETGTGVKLSELIAGLDNRPETKRK